MPDSPNTINQRVGAFEFPYSIEDVDGTQLTITDTAQAVILAVFAAAINDELTGAFQKAAKGTPLEGKLPVADVWPGKPTPTVMKTRKAGFPLLAAYRVGKAPWSELTLSIDQRTQKWGLDLILGPLDVAHEQRIGRVLVRAAVLVQRVMRNRGHKAYQGGKLLWGDQETGALSTIWLDEDEYGPALFGGGDDTPAVYHALSCSLTTTELSSDVAFDAVPLEEMALTLGVGGSSDGVIPALVQARAKTVGGFSLGFSLGFRT